MIRLLLLCLTLLPWAGQANAQTVDAGLRTALEAAVAESDSFEHPFDAEVWLMDMSNRLRPFVARPTARLRLLRLVHREATRAEVAPELVLAVIEVESRFDRYAISSAGAQGLMQVMPFWLEELERPDDNLFDIATNLRFGCTILAYYLDMESGDLAPALARYNGSLGRFDYVNKVLEALNRRWYRQ